MCFAVKANATGWKLSTNSSSTSKPIQTCKSNNFDWSSYLGLKHQIWIPINFRQKFPSNLNLFMVTEVVHLFGFPIQNKIHWVCYLLYLLLIWLTVFDNIDTCIKILIVNLVDFRINIIEQHTIHNLLTVGYGVAA